jgi:CubicO group peptidase (beta-lactamase class C family)
MHLSRRQFTRLAAGMAVLPVLSPPLPALGQLVAPAAGPAAPIQAEREAMANLAQAFMAKYDVPALSLAIGFAGKLIHQDALGWADRESRTPVTSANRFRIASVTKTITSAAIFSLVEQGRVRLSDRVFGPGAIFGTDYGGPPYHPHIDEITVEHLLTHTCGGWSNAHNGPRGGDPMFINVAMNHAQLIAWTLRNRPLDNPPGVHFDYSNFGYCVLGRVIEKISRQPYAVYVREAILKRCGIDDMTIAGNTLAQRQPGEVKYYGQRENPYGMNITRMDSHGGWIARPADILQFFMRVDGFAAPPNILKSQTIQIMTTPTAANPGYAKGWMVNKANNWWHNGTLPGTSTIAVRTHGGFCWAAFTNTRNGSRSYGGDLDKLIWSMARQVKSWRV